MFGEIEGAKLGFVVEHVEVLIELIVVDELGAYFLLIMGEWAKVLILAFIDVVGVVGAEFLLVGLVLIELLHAGVRVSAVFAAWAFVALADVGAHVVGVEVAVPLPVLAVVVIDAVLVLMLLGVAAGVQFEVVDVQILG